MESTNKKSNKTIIQLTVVAIAIILFGLATIGVLKLINSPPPNQPPDQQKAELTAQANTEQAKAQDLLKKGDASGAKKAFEHARGLYQQTGDTSHLKDVNASLSLIERTNTQAKPTEQPPTAFPSN